MERKPKAKSAFAKGYQKRVLVINKQNYLDFITYGSKK
jgi:hypothetical protein